MFYLLDTLARQRASMLSILLAVILTGFSVRHGGCHSPGDSVEQYK